MELARIKRKVNHLKPGVREEETPRQRIYRAGGYVRLSVEDNGRQDAETIENQKAIIRSYIESREDMEFCGLYCDV